MRVEDWLPDHCHPSRRLRSVDLVVIHYISAVNLVLERRYDYRLIRQILLDYGLSYHSLADRTGREYALVPDDQVAWHAGESSWKGREGCNEFSIGLALFGGENDAFTPAQYSWLGLRCAKLMSKHGLSVGDIVGHQHVSPGRRFDPGPNFDWDRLRSQLRYVT